MKLIPKLRFKNFTDKWHLNKLDEVAKITSGGTPSRINNNYWNGNVPWISTSLIDFNVITKADEYITEEGVANSSAKVFPVGTILMAMYGQGKTRGKVAVLGIEATTNQACAAIITGEQIDSKFLFQNLAGRYDEIRNLSNEGGQQNLSGGIIKEIKVSIPTHPEQQKIASFLSAVDEKIQQLTRKKELLEQYKKGVMQQLFSGKLRFKPDYAKASSGSDENGKAYPKWEEKKLGDIGNTFNGLTGKTKENFGEGKPYIQYMQIFANSKIDVSKSGLVQIDKNEEQQRVQYGDVFFTTSSETPQEIGTCSVLLEHVGEMYLNSFCFGFRPNSFEQLLPNFASYLFRNEIFRKVIIRLAQGSTRYNMSKIQLMKLKVLLPSKQEQQKIANYLSAIDTKIENVASQIGKAKTFKKGLLQQMFV